MRRYPSWFVLIVLAVLAFNLRPVAVSVGPVLTQLTVDLNLAGWQASLLTALPTLCFAIFGAMAPWLADRIGVHRAIMVAIVAIIGGQGARAAVGNAWAFLGLSTLALGGMALANVLMPSLVKLHFPNRIGLVTAVYSTSMSIGLTLAGMLTVPLATALGGWRSAFFFGTSVALIAFVLWLAMLRLDRGHHENTERRRLSLAAVGRTRLGWIMALFFGIQSAQAYAIFGWLPTIYSSAGLSEASAGLMLGITTGLGIPLAFALPAYTAHRPNPRFALVVIMAALVTGFIGLMLAPTTLPWLWAVLLAVGTASFPMILALIGLRARTSEGTAALSSFTQSVGYLIAAFGPFLVGSLYQATGAWTWPLIFLLVLAIPMGWTGMLACRPSWLEDELDKT